MGYTLKTMAADYTGQEEETLMMRWTIFSVCGKLVGHLPVCGWLRMATAYRKLHANNVTTGWDDEKNDVSLRSMLIETLARVQRDGPVISVYSQFGWAQRLSSSG